MKKILGFFADPRVVTGLVLLVLVALLFVFGPRFGLEGETRLLVVIGLLMVAMILMLLLGGKKKKSDADIEQSLLLEADSLVVSPGSSGEASEKVKAELQTAIQALKSAKGSQGRSALQDLPWFLVLGQKDSGKSTAIRNSGLTIPSGGETAAGDANGAVRWWFTQQAILLETHHRFAAPDGDRDTKADYDALLGALTKARGETPVQGVVLTISAQDLIRHDSSRLDQYARTLRKRLDAARDRLQTHFPVYLFISKIDLVHGFQEFFSDLEGNGRDQVCGATFTVDQMKKDPGTVFAGEFERLYRSFCRRRVPRMVSEERDDVRGAVYLFPLEFQSIQAKLQRFVDSLFPSDTSDRRPSLRGFYFGSGHCEGQPVEMVVNEVSRVIGLPSDLDDVGAGGDLTRVISDLPAPAAPTPTPASSSAVRGDREPRFLREFFTRVLLMDTPLARPTEEAARRHRFQRYGLRIGGGVLVLALLALMLTSFGRNRSLIKSTVDLARGAAQVTGEKSAASELETDLQLLDALRLRLEDLDRYDRVQPLTLGLGLYRGKEINERGRRLFINRLTKSLLGPSRIRLQDELRQTHPESAEEYRPYLEAYRAYRSLIEPERADPDQLSTELVSLWERAPGRLPESLRTLIPAHVQYAWRDGSQEVRYQADLLDLPGRDPEVVQNASWSIRQFLDPSVFYLAMIDEVSDAASDFTLSRIPGHEGRLEIDPALVAADPRAGYVRGAYTLEGWRNGIQRSIENSEAALKEDFLVREAFDGQEFADMRERLLEDYTRDYVASWVRFLSSVRVTPSVSVAAAADRLQDHAGNRSPLRELLEQAASQLRFRSEKVQELQEIEEHFDALHALFRTAGEGDEKFEPVERWMTDNETLVGLLKDLEESNDPGPASTQFAKEVLTEVGVGQSAIALAVRNTNRWLLGLRTGRADCSNAVRTLLDRTAEAAWGAILAQTQLHLNGAWSLEVDGQFLNLVGRYPFVPASGTEASLEEFVRFFGPDGAFFRFYEAELAPFLDRARQPKVQWRHGLRFSEETLTAIEQAHRYRSTLFQGDALDLEFYAKPSQTKRLDGSTGTPPKSTRLTVGGDALVYDMGAPRDKRLKWPGDRPGASVSGSRAIRTDGEWALFRLMDQATLQEESSGILNVSWEIDGFSVPYTFTMPKQDHPFQAGFFRFECPKRIGPEPGSVPAVSPSPVG